MSARPILLPVFALVVSIRAMSPGPVAAQTLRVTVSPAGSTPAAVAPAPTPAPPPQRSGDYLGRMDTDGDGRISVTEYQDWLSYAFDGMDLDHDGVLSAAEQPGGRGEPITRETHRARLAERFRRQDVDRSGFLDAKELAAPPQGK
jgi:hypothetical protein